MTEVGSNRLEIDLIAETDRYHRQNLISWWDQDKLSEARMLVVGAGALGNELVKNLALIGVGHIVVADLDVIEYSNLARCVFFRPEDEGKLKAEVLAERASELNRDVTVEPITGDVRLEVGLGVFSSVDVVLGGLDNREARLFVNRACWKTGTPWVDGAIEGLMGLVRVFVPPVTACYECTMSERDHELIAHRRSCSLLNREEMEGGKVPTTATTASAVAALQAQEAIKLLHADRLGENTLAGAGFHLVGLTHDSYVVRYDRNEDCLSHDSYDLEKVEPIGADVTFGQLIELTEAEFGGGAVIDLEHEIAVAAECGSCGAKSSISQPVDALDVGAGICISCGEPWRIEFTHSIGAESPLLDQTPLEIGLPQADFVTGRVGFERRFFLLPGSGSVNS